MITEIEQHWGDRPLAVYRLSKDDPMYLIARFPNSVTVAHRDGVYAFNVPFWMWQEIVDAMDLKKEVRLADESESL